MVELCQAKRIKDVKLLSNPTAGSADPYWYEWSIGQGFIIDMLNPDSNIESVTLQSTEVQGLDDVIVKYEGGKTECIQIKHSRTYDTISFGDLVSVKDNKSLLKSIAVAWKKGKEMWSECIPILFTNRFVSTTSGTSKKTDVKRPPLNEFWNHLKEKLTKVETFAEIPIPLKWNDAWTEWCNQLDILENDAEKLSFLKSLRVNTNQLHLDEMEDNLREKLATTFSITIEQAHPLLSLLDNALRKWATTLREKEPVDKEDVYEVLSLPAHETVGEHRLYPPEPFFSSRLALMDCIAYELLNGMNPIVFLSGSPGIGKTSIVSMLANSHESVIDLRYHAFKPITPYTLELSADAGETTKPEVLWGDFLSQLRTIFRGRLAEFEVPIRNEFLNATQLRDHVFRLSEQLGKERGRKTVIAIDGIDHAARAGIDRHSFLETLLPPEGIPDNVRVFIIGQPANNYPKYPDWLKNGGQCISIFEVEGISREDIESLFRSSETSLPSDQWETAIRLIDEVANGNTLSAIFAIHESQECKTVDELQQRLINRRLSSGLAAYYDHIWKAAMEPLENRFPYIGYRISGCFSLLSERINGHMLHDVFKDMGLSESDWNNVLYALRPLVISAENGFVLTHNDVRVHLTKQIELEPHKFKEVASDLADYLWDNPEKAMVRHADLFRLLKLSNRTSDFPRVFTPSYVMEGSSLKRPVSEMIDQCRQTVTSLSDSNDWDLIHNVACATSTLVQLNKSAGWSGNEIEFISDVPPILLSEGSVQSKQAWTLDVLTHTFNDAMTLIRSGNVNRSRGLMKRWFSDISPLQLLEIISEDEVFDKREDKIDLTDKIISLYRTWGRVSQHVGVLWEQEELKKKNNIKEYQSKLLAAFFGGFLKESVEIGGKLRWVKTLSINLPFYWVDIEFCLHKLATQRRWTEVRAMLHNLKPLIGKCPTDFNVKAATYSLLTGDNDLIMHWVDPILNQGFDAINQLTGLDYDEKPKLYCMMCFLISWMDPARDNGDITMEGVKTYFSSRADSRERANTHVVFHAYSFAGNWLGSIHRRGIETASRVVTADEVQSIFSALFRQDQNLWRIGYGSQEIPKILVEILIECGKLIGSSLDRLIFDIVKERCSRFPVNYMLDIGWRYLADRGEFDILYDWFEHWCGHDGKAWTKDMVERSEIVEGLSVLAIEVGFEKEAKAALDRLSWGSISYTGHKEYALDTPLSWFEVLSQREPEVWEVEGKLLLELSEEASRVGDNRNSIYIDAAISTAIAYCGPDAMWQLYNSKDDRHDPHMIFDGIIGMLENRESCEKELLSLWAFGIGTFNWRRGLDRSYLADLKEAILVSATNSGIAELAKKMEHMGPAEFNVEKDNNNQYRIPMRWFEQVGNKNTQDDVLAENLFEMPISDGIDELYALLDRSPDSNHKVWLGVEILAKRLAKERPSGFSQLINRLLVLLGKRRHAAGWSYDGINDAYKAIIPLLHDSKKIAILKGIIEKLEPEENDNIWIESITENLDYICLYRSLAKEKEVIQRGLERVLNTHEIWINGNGFLPEIKRITIPDIKLLENVPNSWSQFAIRYLFDILKTDNGSRIETSLRGLWGLLKNNPSDLGGFYQDWANLHSQAKSWVLLLAERAATSLSLNYYLPFSEVVQQCYEGEDLKLKMQSWIILQSLERNNKGDCPEWKLKRHTDYEKIVSAQGLGGQGVLEVPAKRLGAISLVNGSVIINSALMRLEASVLENVSDIEQKYSAYVKLNPPKPINIMESKKSDGEMIVYTTPEQQRLYEIIYHEVFNGRWNDVPFIRLVQALTESDDPFILLQSPSSANDKDEWPDESELEKLMPNKQAIKERMLPHCHNGISQDEIVLSAVLLTYTRSSDIKILYDMGIKYKGFPFEATDPKSTFNGRTFALYDENRFDPQIDYEPALRMTHEAGGMGHFVNQSLFCYPSLIWSYLFGWQPQPNNPMVWIDENNEIVVRFEYSHGPIRDLIHEPLHRQPIIQRWICKKEAFEKVLKIFDAMPMKSLDVEFFNKQQ